MGGGEMGPTAHRYFIFVTAGGFCGERIYVAARRVGWGHTTTYGTLAKELGAGPEGARDIGQAMARNPVALIIPCHRVLAAGGKLGGFRRRAARRQKSICWRWRASTSSHQ